MDANNLSNLFGAYVFNDTVMRERLPEATYVSLRRTIEQSVPLDPDVAEVVAGAMKEWAIEKGATHYTHWFQPMTGITAEKHDSFISPTDDGRAIMEFSGKELIKGEPDASSFPSGGLRATFEARGYTTWDCTSPAFVKDGSLYIPTAFCSYTGQALDEKTPLLRSMQAISKAAVRVLHLLGDEQVRQVSATIGCEQEYFLVDYKLYQQRLDLMLTGRTLFGKKSPKGQELDDHYFGNIKERVSSYMKELDEELWALGVSAKTKHNEAAPAQHELAPVFTTANIACDHNQLTMEIMQKVALRHGMACLLHEKPFAGVNGSGKHNNWSLTTDTGENLFKPGRHPRQNLRFLLFMSAVFQAADQYADLLRLSAASAANDHRLGANEAPPAIVSIFLGDELTEVFEDILTGNGCSKHGGVLETGVATLPSLRLDHSDRNRTSPLAFTGNKFEFRMLGSSQSVSDPNIMLNAAVADVLCQIADRLEQAEDKQSEAKLIVRDILIRHKRIIFNGNNYSEQWVKEAARRGLPNLRSSVDAIPAIIEEKNIRMLERQGVLSKVEVEARYEIMLENYYKTMHIEAMTMLDIVGRQITPACIEYYGTLASSFNQIKQAGGKIAAAQEMLEIMGDHLDAMNSAADRLRELVDQVDHTEGLLTQCGLFSDQVIPAMREVRRYADILEEFVAKKYWPLPSYSDLLFRV